MNPPFARLREKHARHRQNDRKTVLANSVLGVQPRNLMRFMASIILPMRTENVSQWLCKTCLIIRQTCSESADGLSGLGVSYVNQGEFNASSTHETRGSQIKITNKMHDCSWALLKKGFCQRHSFSTLFCFFDRERRFNCFVVST